MPNSESANQIRELEEKLARSEKSLHELEFLNQLSDSISMMLEPEKIIEIILAETAAWIKAGHASIMLLNEARSDSLNTYIREKETVGATTALDTSCRTIAGWVTKYNDSLRENDILHDPRFEGLQLVSQELQSVLAEPLMVQGKIIGVMVFQNLAGQSEFTPDHARLVAIIAAQSAQILTNAQIFQTISHENLYLRNEIRKKFQFKEIIGRSPAMMRVFDLLEKVIPTDARVVLEGETGTGKELIARALHYNGPRQKQKFLAIDCGAIPENLLESELFGHKKGAFTGAMFDKKGIFAEADGGTLFLDEITNMSTALQAKLLRAIQTGEIRPLGSNQQLKVDVRIITASSRNLKKCVSEGTFREDLFFRLNVISIKLPPLRDRKPDLALLLDHFLKKFAAVLNKPIKGFLPETMRLLESYHWPGNIRELENLVERVVVLAPDDEIRLGPELLPDEIKGTVFPTNLLPPKGSLQAVIEAVERKLVQDALIEFKGNKTRAAKSLGLSRRGLINKIERYRLEEKNRK